MRAVSAREGWCCVDEKRVTVSDVTMDLAHSLTWRAEAKPEPAWPLRFEMALPPPNEETLAAFAAMRERVERMRTTELERVEAAARAMLMLAPGDALDAKRASAEIARRHLSLVHRGSDVVELREGDAVRWRGRWTWEDGQATWSEEWVR